MNWGLDLGPDQDLVPSSLTNWSENRGWEAESLRRVGSERSLKIGQKLGNLANLVDLGLFGVPGGPEGPKWGSRGVPGGPGAKRPDFPKMRIFGIFNILIFPLNFHYRLRL